MPEDAQTNVTAVAAAAQLGGTERVLLDFANLAFEHDIALRVLTPCDGPLVEILGKIGIESDVVPASRRLLRGSQQPGALSSIPGALVGLYAWSRRLARHPFLRSADVAYSVAFKPHIALALQRVHPVVWHLHEFPPSTTGRLWRSLARRIPEGLAVNSTVVADAWVPPTDRALRDRTTVVHNGVNLDRFRLRPRTGWVHRELQVPGDARLIGMPAVFARWKGQFEVIDAFDLIEDQFPEAHLVLVGGSIYDTVAEERYGWELKARVERSNESKRIHLLPFQREIELTYPEFDLAVHYSLRPEPFGRVITEAMACGVPVIAAAEGGPVDILGEGIGPRREAGWLAEPRHPETLAQILSSALRLPSELLQSVGAAGRRRAEDVFSARRFARDLATALKGIARRHGGG